MKQALLCLAALLFLPTLSARADGLSIRHLTLDKIFPMEGAALVTVRSINKGILEGQVHRTWGAANQAKGQVHPFTLQTEPRGQAGKWVIVNLYWNLLRGAAIGDRVIIVGGNILANTPALLRKLDLISQDKWRETYSKSNVKTLSTDLADLDLFSLAYAALSKRLAQRPADLNRAIISATMKAKVHNPLDLHLGALNGLAHGQLLTMAVAQWEVSRSSIIKRSIEQAFDYGKTSKADEEALRRFAYALRPTDKEELKDMNDLGRAIVKFLDKTPEATPSIFVDFFAQYLPQRPHSGGSEEATLTFLAKLPRDSRVSFIKKLISGLKKSKVGAVDQLSFSLARDELTVLPLIEKYSFAHGLIPLLDPDGTSGCTQIADVVKIIVSLATKKKSHQWDLRHLAKVILPKYRCNVDSKLKVILQGL